MGHEAVSPILLSSQFAHALGDGPWGKNTLGFPMPRQERGEHVDQQSGVQPVALELPRAELDNRLHDLPDTLHDLMWLPQVPDGCPPQRSLTNIYQSRAACGAGAKKAQTQRSTGGTRAPDAPRWHVHAPWGLFPPHAFFPCCRSPLLPVNRQDIVTFAGHDDGDTSQLMPPFSACYLSLHAAMQCGAGSTGLGVHRFWLSDTDLVVDTPATATGMLCDGWCLPYRVHLALA